MREIIFRGKDKTNGKWIKGDLMHPHMQTDCEWMIFPIDALLNDAMAVDPSTIGQYTGMKDLNGTPVFEGDIFEIKDHNAPVRGVVKFGRYDNSTGTGAHVGFFVTWNRDLGLRNDSGYWIDRFGATIIGNIHDNPELLEV